MGFENMKITTEMCKKFIQENLGINESISIKRTKKYKDEEGLVARDFLLGNGEQCTIVESDSGELKLKDSNNSSNFSGRIFTDDEKKEAKKFIKSWAKKIENGNVEIEDCINAANQLPDKSILTSQFVFNFPEDMYSNDSSAITNGLNTPFAIPGNDSFCIMLIEKNGTDPDLYMNDVVKDLLPAYLTDLDEYCYGMENNSYSGTVQDVIEELQAIGFEYKKTPKDSEECLFKKYKAEPKVTRKLKI